MDKPLFTPGPLTTSPTVKAAMLRDLGSRDSAFIQVVREIRAGLLHLGGVSTAGGYEAVLLQGSGTFGIEAMISSLMPPEGGRLLVVVNGAYGRRMVDIARRYRIPVESLVLAEDEPATAAHVSAALHPGITHLALVHCETTTGLLNPPAPIGRLAREHGITFFLDAMSAFGGIPTDLAAVGADVLVSSANKCIEGVPGFSFALCRRAVLEAAEGWARTISLDLVSQWRGLEADGQFRFTPPTHALLAFHQALQELEAEGGVVARNQRYTRHQARIVAGLGALGLTPYLPADVQAPIITAFREPNHPNYSFSAFYNGLNERGFVIYPGKLSTTPCFRIGNIGRLTDADVEGLVAAVGAVLREMGAIDHA